MVHVYDKIPVVTNPRCLWCAAEIPVSKAQISGSAHPEHLLLQRKCSGGQLKRARRKSGDYVVLVEMYTSMRWTSGTVVPAQETGTKNRALAPGGCRNQDRRMLGPIRMPDYPIIQAGRHLIRV